MIEGEEQLYKTDLRISVSNTDHPTIKIIGEADYHNAQAIRDAAKTLIDAKSYVFTIDVEELGFIDSSGLSALLDASKEARSHDGEVHLLAPSAQLIHVLTIAGFMSRFSIIPKNGAVVKDEELRLRPSGQPIWQVTQFDIPSSPEMIAELRNKVAEFAGALPFTNQDIEDIKLAVGEAGSNALRYGCPNSTDHVSVRCCLDGDSLRVQVKDNGPGFDPDAITTPSIEALEEGGRGIFFMRILMDEVKFFFSASGAVVEMVKYTR